MKKKYLIILLFLNISFGQNKDSLLTIIKNYKIQDTLQCYRLRILIDAESDIEVWKKYNEQLGLICSKELTNKGNKKNRNVFLRNYGTYYNNLGLYNSFKDNYETALLNYKKAIFYFEKSGFKSETASTYINCAVALIKKGETKTYFKYYDKALNIYKKVSDSAGIATVYADLGYQYAENGAENKALEYFFKSLNISEKIKNEESKIRALEYLVKTLKSQNENEKALYYSKQLVKYFIEISDNESLALIYFSMASTYNAINDKDKMFEFVNKSLLISKKTNLHNVTAANYGLLSKFYLSKNQLEEAFKYSKLELKIREISLKEPAFTKSLNRYVEILAKKQSYQEGLKKGKEAYNKSILLENPDLILYAAKNLKSIYAGLNNKSKAFEFAEIELKMIDSLSKVTSQNSAIKSLFKYETEIKDNQLKQLSQAKKITELENQRQKTTLFLLVFGIISALITSFLLFKRYKANKQNELLKSKIEKTQAENKATESELKALKSQMNPHFIFNALSSIQDQFMFGDKVIANEQMGNFTYLTRQILNVSGKKQILLSTEIDILSKYLELEKMRFKNDFSYSVTTSDAIDEDYHEIPPMLIQPFVENSIKHGLMHKNGLKTISIDFDLDENGEHIICTIIDNGIGRTRSAEIKAKNQSKHRSFSTESIAQRLELLNENHSIKQLISYSDLVENDAIVGTKVVINIPLG